MARSTTHGPDPELRAKMLDRARELVPTLRARAFQAEQDRRMPDVTHQEFVEAGFYRIYQPARYGGTEMDLALTVDLCAELARGCASSTWLFSNMASHSWIAGMHYPETQELLWGDNPEALIASSFPAPGATVTPVDGGIKVDGKWSFSSGIDQADWQSLQIMVPREGAPPEARFALIPRSKIEVVDDWFVNGLAATGSRSLIVRDAFIPERRTLKAVDMHGGRSPGSEYNPNPLYRMPLWAIGVKLFSGIAIGCARGAIEVMEDELRTRRSVGAVEMKALQSVHLRLAEASARVDAGWALMRADCEEATELTAAGAEISLDARVRWRRNDAFVGKLCLEAVEQLYPLAGGRGIGMDSDFQRCWRDLHAATSQITMAWDICATNYGKARMGIPFFDPRLWPFPPGAAS
jgi:3-hydroxy-9,10-secoandrosta-1,3,5(10)-triene-9,17-dione monooxygenase